MKCKNEEIVEPVFVIDADGPQLLGRTAIQALNLVKICAVGDCTQCLQRKRLAETMCRSQLERQIRLLYQKGLRFPGSKICCVNLVEQRCFQHWTRGKHIGRLSEGSREITSFMAAGKVYQFKRLLFRLASAPEAYQRVMSSDRRQRGMEQVG